MNYETQVSPLAARENFFDQIPKIEVEKWISYKDILHASTLERDQAVRFVNQLIEKKVLSLLGVTRCEHIPRPKAYGPGFECVSCQKELTVVCQEK